MPKCVYKHRKNIKMCSGDFNKAILVETRSLTEPENINDDVDYKEEFTIFSAFWAMVETAHGETIFDGSNIERVVTHRFYVRYVTGLTFEKWIRYNGKKYMIVDVENINEQNDFILLRTTVRGDAELPVNFQ